MDDTNILIYLLIYLFLLHIKKLLYTLSHLEFMPKLNIMADLVDDPINSVTHA